MHQAGRLPPLGVSGGYGAAPETAQGDPQDVRIAELQAELAQLISVVPDGADEESLCSVRPRRSPPPLRHRSPPHTLTKPVPRGSQAVAEQLAGYVDKHVRNDVLAIGKAGHGHPNRAQPPISRNEPYDGAATDYPPRVGRRAAAEAARPQSSKTCAVQ